MDLTPIPKPSIHMQVTKSMPVLREPVTRPGRNNLNLMSSANREAVMFQCVGPVAATPCKSCLRNSGPFVECVQSDEFWQKQCANCHYNAQGKRCEYHAVNRKDEAGKRKNPVRVAHVRARDNGKEPSKRKGPSKKIPNRKKGNAGGQKEQQVVQQSSVDVQQAERIYRLMRTAGASFEAAAVGLSTVGQTLMMVAGLYAEDAGFASDNRVEEEQEVGEETDCKKRKKQKNGKAGWTEKEKKKKKGKKGKKDHQKKKQRRK
ncbi:hypothetical protein BO78DRAFT_388884 [Aspergillus sclerotiicarbonarius CBS 121057]|uniref:Uncharacterized protein n=1 Tax=Aspergillus sclerotiicarbonarius (strain CBS 121057 / IBT 28362) TaxID=1448318 RepID=A0A319E239_ASPSB|nr:hypothetical protein BO78DRAFT_388884 [Aspergillus sclerotiicarbonarius CBS 121057]